jgi:hypothetical protein
MISKKKIRQKKMSTPVNFSNLWLESSDRKHYIWKNHEAQSLENKMLKDEIEKKLNKKIQNKK